MSRTAPKTVSHQEVARAFEVISGAASEATPSTLESLQSDLDAARKAHPKEVQTIEAFLSARGFGSFRRRMQRVSDASYAKKAKTAGAEKRARELGGKATTSAGARGIHRSQIEQQPIDVTATLPPRVKNDPFLAAVAKTIGGAKTKDQRVAALVEATDLAVRRCGRTLGLSGFQSSLVRFSILRDTAKVGPSLWVITFDDLLYAQYSMENRLEDILRRYHQTPREPRAPVPARGVPSSLEALGETVATSLERGEDYGTAANAAAEAGVATSRFVAQRIGASDDEIKDAAFTYFERDAGLEPGCYFLVNSADLAKPGGEAQVRAAFAQRLESAQDILRQKAVQKLGTNSRSVVHPAVWARWQELAGDVAPSRDCPSAREARSSVERALDMQTDLATNRKRCMRIASWAESGATAPSRENLRSIRRTLESRGESTLDPVSVDYLKTAVRSLRRAVAIQAPSLEDETGGKGYELSGTLRHLEYALDREEAKTSVVMLASEPPRNLEAVQAQLDRPIDTMDLRHPEEIAAYMRRASKADLEYVSDRLERDAIQPGTRVFWQSALDLAAIGAL